MTAAPYTGSGHPDGELSAYLDGELSVEARERVDAHLTSCPACTATLEELRRLVATAGTVASSDAPPASDLWSGIHARLSGPASRHAGAADWSGRRVSLGVWQLAAAAVLVAAVSAATAWVVRGGWAGGTQETTPVVYAELEPTPASEAIRPIAFADEQYDAAVADLERALEERRNVLHPRTVEILERNLLAIDAATAQARRALAEDPANLYLSRHLVESRRRKLDLLRRAAAITEGN